MIDEHERTLWDAVLLVIKEANGRYGLKLYGNLTESVHGYTLAWFSETTQHLLSLNVDYPFNKNTALFIAREGIGRVRIIAEQRDRANRHSKEIADRYSRAGDW